MLSLRLPETLAAWKRGGPAAVAAVLAAELGALGPAALPLGALSGTGYALEDGIALAVLAVREEGATLRVRLGVQFQEIAPGCSCGDEAEPQPAYGELDLVIDRASAAARIAPAV